MASAALALAVAWLALAVRRGVGLALRPWVRAGPVSSHSSRAPSARTHAEGRLGGGVPRRRSRSSGKRAPAGRSRSRCGSRRRRIEVSRAPRDLTCAPAGDIAPLLGPARQRLLVVTRAGGGSCLPTLAGRRAASACVAGRARPGLPDPARDAPAPPPPPALRLVPLPPVVRRSAPPLDRVDDRPLAPPAPPSSRRPPGRRLRTRPHGPRSAPGPRPCRRAGGLCAHGRDDSAGGISAAPVDSTWPTLRPPAVAHLPFCTRASWP